MTITNNYIKKIGLVLEYKTGIIIYFIYDRIRNYTYLGNIDIKFNRVNINKI